MLYNRARSWPDLLTLIFLVSPYTDSMKSYYSIHFIAEESEARRGKETCLNARAGKI